MGCCSAINCSNRAEKGHTMYRFPSDPKRRKMWLCNMRRGKWIPTNSSRLCEMHFENSQFENHRADGKIKLKPNALPTLFDVPNPPPMINPAPRRSVYKVVEDDRNCDTGKDIAESVFVTTETNSEDKVEEEMTKLRRSNLVLSQSLAAEREKVKKLVEENEKLERSLKIMNETLKSFLNEDQITLLNNGRVSQYSNQTIIKGLKFRLALSVHGLEYLRSTGYPLPAYCTIMRRIQDLRLDFGIFEDVLELLAFKTKTMDSLDRYCIPSFDEFLIASHLDHDKNLGKFVGHVTIGMDHDLSEIGEKIFVVIARGVKSKWKQVIACHVTSKKSIDDRIMKNFILSCISAVEACGLVVLALSSDLDSRNRSFYSSLGVTATREGVRRNLFQHNAHDIVIIPDPCHILKNLKSAMLRQIIYLPESFIEAENLPTNKVNGTFITHLWNLEISNGLEQRFLHHLKAEDIEPNNFQKMNVGAAVRFFSPKTASALTAAVELNLIPKEALTTARFVQVVHEWFTIISSQERKKSITSRNCDVKYIFLHCIIDLFQNSVFHQGWKPLNFAVVVATLSFCDIAEFLLSNGFDFVLGHRFTQDATENVISQIRKRAGQMPTAMKALSAVKIISVSQFVSDVKSTNYMNDTDEFLLDLGKEKSNQLISSN